MLIISIRDNESDGWKRNPKTKTKEQKKKQKNKDKKEQGGTEGVIKAWELHDFVVHLS